MLSPKRFYQFLLLAAGGLSLYFTLSFGFSFFHYLSLRDQAQAQIFRWEVVELKGDRFGIKADYSFRAQNKDWEGAYLLKDPYYLNEFAALSDLKKMAKQEWTVWFNPNNIQESAIEKKFPLSLLIKSLICCVLLIYFLFFKTKIQKLDALN